MDLTAAALELASWTAAESQAFFESFSRNGRAWAKIAADVQTKSVEKVQTYFHLLLHLIQHALGRLDIDMNFEDSRDSFLALITYYGVLCDSGLTAFTPAFNEVMRDRVKKQKLVLSKLKEEKKMLSEKKVKHEKLRLTLLPRSPLLEGHLRSAHLTPFLKLTLNSAKPLSTVVKHIASKWSVLTNRDSGTPFVGGQWRLYPNGHVHAGWGESDDKPNVMEVYEALHRPEEFTLLYDCTSKAPVRPTMISSVPLTRSGTIPAFLALSPPAAPSPPNQASLPHVATSVPAPQLALPLFAISPTQSAARAVATFNAKGNSASAKKPVKKLFFSSNCHINPKLPSRSSASAAVTEVDSKGNLYGAFAVGKGSPAAPSHHHEPPTITPPGGFDDLQVDPFLSDPHLENNEHPQPMSDPQVMPQQQHLVHAHPQLQQQPTFTSVTDPNLAADLEALNDISLSSLLMHPLEPSQQGFSQASKEKANGQRNHPLTRSLFEEVIAASTPNKVETPPVSEAAENEMSKANQGFAVTKPGHEFSLPMLNEDSNQFGLGLFGLEDSLKFPTVSQHGTDFNWNFSNHSNSGERIGGNDLASPFSSPKKRIFPDAFESSAFENELDGFIASSGFSPFGSAPTSAPSSTTTKSTKHVAKKPRKK